MPKVTIQSLTLGRKGFQGLAGLALAAAMLPVAVKAAATDSAVVDDYESASNQNKFLGYSFFYNDSKDGGNTVVKSAVAGTGTELKWDPILSVGEGANGSLKAAKLDFTFGATKPSCGGTCTYGQMAGYGTGFVAEGKVIDMTGATSITFMAKASAVMTMRVEIATSTVTNFGYHLASVPVSTGYTLVTINLTEGIGGVAQPSWAAAAPNTPVVFDPSKIQKIQFAISADDNLGLTAGTVFIDNIVVHGYKWVPPNACMLECEGVGTGALLSDMEKAPANQNAVGGYWYAYNDAEGRTVAGPTDYSEIYLGVTPDSLAPTTPKIAISATKGAANSAGAYIAFKLGPQYTKPGTTEAIKPFVGIGTKVSDALLTKFSNFGTATGISFSYSTDAGSKFDYIRLEAKSNRVYSNPGIVHAALLPATNGVWVSVVVPWARLLLPDWQEVALIPAAEQTLKLTEMEKFQWAVQGDPGTTGGFAVDNVKIEGMVAPLPVLGSAAIFGSVAKSGKGFSVAQGLHGVQVALRLNETEKNATIRLIDMKGNIVATQTVSGNGLQTAELGKANLPSGVYSVQVNLGNRQLSAPVTVLP